ncbi:DUF6520 family protein [Aequorivita antarctica]|uniref:DUF3551 domain-containing protein n=1 Tax=Aequorivita antarctica TaxID=153266 RepID=A0A5C6YZV1_9FLAO|nr:DUF6520 family protein [Aequorivita antarctica]TXD73315.1 hypothetical protein ESU54_09280 [Aequorivita antarctica]SRX76481.1 hypothetical protein AEQU3_03481 [Aequorivita antarctica]
MKTKILKFGMPLMAFLLAIVFAFASEKSEPVEKDTLIPGYIQGTCELVSVNCSVSGGPVCQYDGKNVTRFKSGNNCHTFLYEWMP